MKHILSKKAKRQQSHRKIRMKIFGTKDRPRLCVFRSSKHVYAQLVDDSKGKVLVSVSDMKIKSAKGKVNKAVEVGKIIAKEAQKQKIEKVIFDRAGFVFHGRVKSVADGAREGGLKF